MRRLLLMILAVILLLTACNTKPVPTSSNDSSNFEDNTPVDTSVLIKYPEYPEEVIPRDYDYYVKVTQGDKSIELPVYNKVVASDYFNCSMYNSDIHRRFAEFAFADAPVTIEVTVNLPFESVTVMPSSQKIKTAVKGNVITYTLDKPQNTMVKLNDDRDTILAIFAEAPETEIPDKNDPNVLYFEAGYHDVGALKLQSGQTVYLEAGAVVQARTLIQKADNVTICGRGALLESSPTRMAVDGVNYMCEIINSSNIKLEGIKILDAHTFNITMQGVKNIEISNIKVLSNQISTDGLSWWSRNENVYAHDSFWHISDDVFVVTGGGEGRQLIENCIVGSDYGTFTIGDYTGEKITFRNMDIFRSGRMFKCHSTRTLGLDGAEVLTENIYAEDTTEPRAQFMDLQGFVNVGRTFTLKNFYAPNYKRPTLIFDIANDVIDTKITADNVWIGGKQFTTTEGWLIRGLDGGNEIIFTENSDSAMVGTNITKTKKYTPISVYIGGMRVKTAIQPFIEGGDIYVPLKEVAQILEVTLPTDLEKINDNPVAKLDYINQNLPLKVRYDAEKQRLTFENIEKEGNLLRNPDIELGLTTDWVTRSFTELYLSEDAHSGNYSIKLYKDNDSYENSDANGIYQDVVDTLRRFGQGTYKLTAYVKKGEKCTVNEIEIGITREFAPEGTGQRYTLTDEWQKIEYIYSLSEEPEYFNAAFFYVGYMSGEIKDVLVDDLSLEKIG